MLFSPARRSSVTACLLIGVASTYIVLVDPGTPAGAAAPVTGTYVWVDDPLSGSVVEAGAVGVQVHGNDAGAAMSLLVDGKLVASQPPSGADGRLATVTLSWPAQAGVHSLVARVGSLSSVASVVHVVPAAGSSGGGTPGTPLPTVGASPASPSNPPSSNPSNPPNLPSPSSPSSSTSSSSSSPTSSSSPSNPSSNPSSSSLNPSSSSSLHLHHLPPVISAVSADPATINLGFCNKVQPLAVAAHVSWATSVVAQFVDISGVRLQVPLANTGGLWTTSVYPNQFPEWDHVYGLWVQAAGAGGTSRAPGTAITVDWCTNPIH